MRAQEFLTEKGFWNAVGKGATMVAKGYGLIDDNAYEKLMKNHTAEEANRLMLEKVMQSYTAQINVIAKAKPVDKEAIGDAIKDIMTGVLQVPAIKDEYHNAFIVIHTETMNGRETVKDNEKIKEAFSKVIAMSFNEEATMRRKTIKVWAGSDSNSSNMYYKNKAKKWDKFEAKKGSNTFRKTGELSDSERRDLAVLTQSPETADMLQVKEIDVFISRDGQTIKVK